MANLENNNSENNKPLSEKVEDKVQELLFSKFAITYERIIVIF